jgi:perosamine synthetase
MGVAQMEQLTTFLRRKAEITAFYNARLSKIEGFVNQKILADVNPNYWLYTIKIPRAKSLLAHFKNLAIEARPFWVPMNQLPANESDLYYTKTDVSNQIYDTCVSLPCSTNITDEQLEIVVKNIEQFYGV